MCAYVEAWFSIEVVDNTVVQSCLNSWMRHVLFRIFTQRHVFFHSCKDIPTEFSISYWYSSRQFVFSRTSAEMLVWTTFYLSLYPLLFDCFFILCFFFKFSAFSLDLEVQKASVLIIWIFFRCFKNGSFLVISLQAIWWTGFFNTLWRCQNFRIGFSRCRVSLFASQSESTRLVAACSPQFNHCSFTAVLWVP